MPDPKAGRKPWTAKDITELIKMRGEGATLSVIAYRQERSAESVAWKVKQLISQGKLHAATHHVRKDYKAPHTITLPHEPNFDHFFRIRSDTLNISDIHFPYPHRELFFNFLKVAEKQKIRTCVANGDLANLDSMSRFATAARGGHEFEKELVQIQVYLDQLLKVFDNIYITQGNHEDRFFKWVHGTINHERFWKMIHDEVGKRIHVSDYKFSEVTSGGKKWLIGHPDAFAQAGGSTPAAIADIRQANIITGHNHMWGVQISKSGHYVGIDHGCACNPKKIEYYAKGFSKLSVWQNGFSMIKNGFGYAFNWDKTDWSRWI